MYEAFYIGYGYAHFITRDVNPVFIHYAIFGSKVFIDFNSKRISIICVL